MRLTQSCTCCVGRELLYVTDLGGPVATVQVVDVNTGVPDSAMQSIKYWPLVHQSNT